MIGYVTLGSNDLPRAFAFYDALMAEVGATRSWESETGVSWGRSANSLAVMKPFNGEPATVGNGVMVALAMRSKEDVDRIYAKAISLGATDEGRRAAWHRVLRGYFRDLDGNKLCVCDGLIDRRNRLLQRLFGACLALQRKPRNQAEVPLLRHCAKLEASRERANLRSVAYALAQGATAQWSKQ